MTDYVELDRIALALLQVSGLLFPVALLTIRFYFNEFAPDAEGQELEKPGRIMYILVSSVAITGLFSTMGILDVPAKDLFIFFALVGLIVFFVAYLLLLRLSLRLVLDK